MSINKFNILTFSEARVLHPQWKHGDGSFASLGIKEGSMRTVPMLPLLMNGNFHTIKVVATTDRVIVFLDVSGCVDGEPVYGCGFFNF
jgi:hypothetical protein